MQIWPLYFLPCLTQLFVPPCTDPIQQRYLERLKGKFRMYLEKISLDLEEEKELGMQLG